MMTLSPKAAAFLVSGCLLGASTAMAAGDIPAPTQKILNELGLKGEILAGLDKELEVPTAWIEAAKKEGAVRISSTWDPDQFEKMTGPFLQRYPFIKQEYSRGSRQERGMKPLIAIQSGRITADLISGIGALFTMFKEAGVLEDLRDLPGWNNVPDGMKEDDGGWVGLRLRYWCMSYNTDMVKPADLPKTWDDLLTNPVWRNGHIGISDRPNLWLAPIWSMKEYGETWGRNYIQKLFKEVRPQLRKEGNNALQALVIAGEFWAALPAADYRTKQYVDKGAPINWHCPEPVPFAISELSMIKGNPHPYAAKIWLNWFLSKEGQLAQFYADGATPVHKDLQTKEFLPFPETLANKKIAFRDPEQMETDLPIVMEAWNPMWEQGTKVGK